MMTIYEAMEKRHTVRTYNNQALDGDILTELLEIIERLNQEGNLHMQLVNGRENAFDDFIIHYGKWTGVTNYIALVGADREDLDECCGYYGEQIVLWAQMHGLKTGWLDTQPNGTTDAFEVATGERHVLSIAIGYSELEGKGPKAAEIEEMSVVEETAPDWFYDGMKYAVLAPTAGNQRLFRIKWDGENVSISSVPGFLEKVDLGIAKYHFEVGSGKEHSIWAK